MKKNRLRELGEQEASSWMLEGTLPAHRLAASVRTDSAALEGLCRRLEREDAQGAARWLPEHLALVRRAGTDAASRCRGMGRLPALSGEQRLPRVQQVGLRLAALDELTARGVNDYLEGIQETEPLTEEELDLLPGALAAGLLAALRRTGEEEEALLRRGESAERSEAELREEISRLQALRSGRLIGDLEPLRITDRFLRRDPAGVYPRMDAESRRGYRRALCRLARRTGSSETACAQQLLEQANARQLHVGTLLFPAVKSGGDWYFLLLLALTVLAALGVGLAAGRWWASLLFLLPVSEPIKNGLDFLLLRLTPPRPVFRLELKQGVPPEGKTLCVIAALLTGTESADAAAEKLQRYACANRRAGEQVCYGLLADLPDGAQPPSPEEKALLAHAAARLEALNQTGQGRFFLFCRPPVYQQRERRYQGWERKRGAILELTRWLRGGRSGLTLLAGERQALEGTRFLLVLDEDTILTIGAVTGLVGVMLHPLNRPVVDRERRVVTSGYGILQPRVETELTSASATVFSKLFGGLGGRDPYGGAVSDLYHDLFDQASFLGKGLIDISAFHTCMDGRFPENRVLSHDLLEGSYLRAGWVSQVELLDSFPASPLNWLARYHRWLRGDWQLLPWLLPAVRDQGGAREKNPISRLARWKLADNLRRSLTPTAEVLALTLGLLLGEPLLSLAVLTALLSAAAGLLYDAAELLLRRGAGGFRRYQAGRYAGLSGAALRTAAQLLFLPAQGWTALCAVVTALWRMCVSKRNLLEWVSSAQRAGSRDSARRYARRFWPCAVLGAAGLLRGEGIPALLLSLGWLAAPLLFWHWGRPEKRTAELSARDRAFLLREGTLIWQYFARWLRPEYHDLIPDNVQALPDKGPALRTSPTNLGLSLLSCLSAADLQLAFPRQALELIERQLTALEGLEKWHGHLYNWYDLRTARPMTPRVVSTVDSGNLCGDLLALAQGLTEYGRPELAARAGALARKMNFALLYDAARELFYVSYDETGGRYSSGHYDLMASEARMTSYLAVTLGQVPPRHWRQLSRALVQAGRWVGMASWNGSMFEYLMPQILLPCQEDSLLSETLAFCLRQQRRQGRRAGIPWGCSESAYYALDREQNYQYKAHGVPALGLQRGLRRELVIAPYASFLALLVSPEAAIANLRRLRELGAEGRYGFYEALDYTPARGAARHQPLIVSSWMAHHLGMSLTALDNCLNGRVWQRRLLRDPELAAGQELLQEKIPVGAPVTRPEPPERRRFAAGKLWRRQGSGCAPEDPVWGVLSNGGYSVLLCADGRGPSRAGQSTILHPDGIELSVTLGEKGWSVFPLTSAGPELRWEYRSGRAELVWQGPAFTLTQEILVERLRCGECRKVTLTARQRIEGRLGLLLRPVLSPWDDYAAHPAFSRMCVESKYIGSGVRFVRRPGRGAPQPELTALWEGLDVGWTTNRERYLPLRSLRHTGREGTVLDPCLALELPFALERGQSCQLRLALGVGDRENSLLTAQSLLALRRPVPSPLLDQLGRGLEPGTCKAAFVLLSRLQQPVSPGREGAVQGQSALWPFGISGDLPLAVGILPADEPEDGRRLIRLHGLLSRLGYHFDLALLLPEREEYRQELRARLVRFLEQEGRTAFAEQAGGVHLISGPPERWEPILGMASVVLRPGDTLTQSDELRPRAAQLRKLPQPGEPPAWRWEADTFVLRCQGSLPPLRWSQLLVSDRFGWRCDEAGTGHLWYRSAQLEQLTPWRNDPLAWDGPEELRLETPEGARSLFARPDDCRTEITYGPGWAVWEKRLGSRRVTLTAFVPVGKAVRLFLIACEGVSGKERLLWRITPKLAHRDSQMPWVRWQRDGNRIAVTNPAGTLAGETLLLMGSCPMEAFSTHMGQGTLQFSAERPLVLCAGMAPEEEWSQLLDWEQALAELERTKAWWRGKTGSLRVETPDAALNHYLSVWGRYQVLAGRIMGRSGLYQCGGAYGFRDQLQDVLALIPFAPEQTREQLARAARRQFREGDVLHWWHPVPGSDEAQGVRTRISDDLLWLPYALGRYTAETGDETLLRERQPWLEGKPLEPGERERFAVWQPAAEAASLYEHAVQAVECVLNRGLGEHQLCRMGTGDWNDGMNRVGVQGRGESVWLTWFVALTLRRFLPLCRSMGEQRRAERYRILAGQLADAANRAWDGAWYLRAYDDAGQPLGSGQNRECAIDSVAQSFAVLAPGPDPARAKAAVLAAFCQLYDPEHQLVRLLKPPFSGQSDPGYLRSYPEGLRENGGQYTHAACWLALALLEAGETEAGAELLLALLPERHPPERYLAEPFVLAGDVYTAPEQEGRGGWSWYTGAAGWYCQTAAMALLGLRLEAGRLQVRPRLPAAWPGYEAEWRGEKFVLRIRVTRGTPQPLLLDGAPCPQGIPLSALSGAHDAALVLPEQTKTAEPAAEKQEKSGKSAGNGGEMDV